MSASESRSSFARGGSTVMVGQLLYVCVTLLSVVILSRLLPPADFGLIAMVGVLLALGEQLRDLGISTSALRSPHLSNSQASNLFWMTLVLSGVATLALALGAPLVADIYGEPRLAVVTPVLALTILLNGIQAQFQVQLARNHRYAALAYVNVVANLAGVSAAVVGALMGWGYWALVVQSVTFSLVGLLLRVYAAQWRPQRFLRRAGTKNLIHDGINYSASSLINYASRNADVFMLGLKWHASEVGLYSRANQFVTMVNSFVAALTNVAIPVLNAEKTRGVNLTRSALRIQSMVGIPMALIFTAMAVCAETFIPIALGPGWEGSVPLLKVLCLGGLGYGLFYINYWVFLVLLQSRSMLAYSLVGQLACLVLIIIGSFHSPLGTATGVAAGQMTLWLIGFAWLSKSREVRADALLKNGIRLVATSSITFAIATWLVVGVPHGTGFTALVAEVSAVVVLFVTVLATTRRGRAELRQGVSAVRGTLSGRWRRRRHP